MKARAVGCAGGEAKGHSWHSELLVQHAGSVPNWSKEPLASGTWGGPLLRSVYLQDLN